MEAVRMPGPNDSTPQLEERPYFEQLGEMIHDSLSMELAELANSPLDEPFLGAVLENEGVIDTDERGFLHSQKLTMGNGKQIQIDVYELD